MKVALSRVSWPFVGFIVSIVVLAGATVAVSHLQRSDSRPPAQVANTSDPFEAPTVVTALGDSYSNGAGASADSKRFLTILSKQMCWVSRRNAAASTGYVAASSTDGPYISRVDQVVASHPNIVLVQGSTNDASTSPAREQAAAVELLTTLKQRLPMAQIYVVGPTLPPVSSPTAISAISQALAAASVQVAVKYFDPVASNWIKPGRWAKDNLHPDDMGHSQLAAGLIAALKASGAQRGAGCVDPLP